jgi:hypothetical protein
MKSRFLLSAAAAALAIVLPAVASAATGVSFIIDGNTLNGRYGFTNAATAGEKITAFGFDLSTIPGGPQNRKYFFDSSERRFAPFGGSDITTGLTSIPVVPDNSQAFQIAFNDFDVGETFQFLIDIDSSRSTTTFGNDLIGATVWFMFDNNTRVEGALYAVDGNPRASQFVTERVISAVPEPATSL